VLDIDPNTVSTAARAQENSQLQAIYAQEDGPKLWNGPFRAPVQGPVTTDFGTHRPYEYHPGTDFGVGAGSPVVAPARGVVVFEGQEPARGNVMVLDHGAGVYSTYAHLQRFEVESGQDVQAGETIARVGTTGFSTGPHLHWELWADGSNVDPMDWTQRSYP
jgi:murein DD-endopeptidase MepM/ murein hydrolase activator NlpD